MNAEAVELTTQTQTQMRRALAVFAVTALALAGVSLFIAGLALLHVTPAIDYCMRQPVPAAITRDSSPVSWTYSRTAIPLGVSCTWFTDEGSSVPKSVTRFTDGGTVPATVAATLTLLAAGLLIARPRAVRSR